MIFFEMKTESLFSELDFLRTENEQFRMRTARDQDSIKSLRDEVSWLHEQIKEFKRNRFGKKSERWESEEQALLFNEAEKEAKNPDIMSDDVDEAPGAPEIEVPAHKRARGHRKPLPENLEREIVKVELPLEEQISADGAPLKVIGWEISEKLKYEPAKITVVQYQRAKYGVDSGDYERTAPPVPAIIPKGIATPELLAAIMVGKYVDGLPLYRMEEIFLRQDIELSRGTMARWMIKLAEALRPIWNVLNDKLLESFYVAVDETHTQVLKENGRKAESKSWMWVRSTPFGEKKIVLFDYSPSRSGEVAKTLFADYQGFLQCDGLASYNCLEYQNGLTRIGCNMHARRRFEKAMVTGAKAGKSLGEKGLEYYQKLYAIEEEIKEMPPDKKKTMRDEFARPLFLEMKAWVQETKSKVPPKSRIGEAFSYFENEYEYLTGYLKDGRLEPDNGFTERAIRKFAIGRNAWMFSDSVDGAEASSVLYSLAITAKINGVNPYRALVELFTELPKAQSIEDFETLAEIILSPSAEA
jgi:transposase